MRGSIILSGVYSGPYYYDRKQPYGDYVKKYNDNGFYREVDRRDAVSRWSKFRASILPIESVSVTCNQDLGVDYPAEELTLLRSRTTLLPVSRNSS